MLDLNMFHGKMSDFVSFSLLGLTLVIKLRSFDFESYWNVSIFFLERRMVSDLIMLCQAVSDLVSALVFEQNVCNKLRNNNFTFYLNSSIFLIEESLSDQNLSCFLVLFLFFGITIEIVLNLKRLYWFWNIFEYFNVDFAFKWL